MDFKKVEVPEFLEKSSEELEKMTAKDLATYQKQKMAKEKAEQNNALVEAIEDVKEDAKKSSEEKEKETEALKKELKSVQKSFDLLELKLKAIEEISIKVKNPEKGTLRDVILANKEKINALKENKQGVLTLDYFVNKAQSSEAPSDIADRNRFAQMLNGVDNIATDNPNQIRPLFKILPTNREYIAYPYQVTVTRDAQNVANCTASVHTSKIAWDVADLRIKKVRDFTYVCLDMIDDYTFVQGQVRDLVDTDVALQVDKQLLLGDGTSENLNGVASYASTFSASTTGANFSGSISNPTLIDLLVVAAAQISIFGKNNSWNANVIALNPIDYATARLLKDTDNNTLRNALFIDNKGNIYIDGIRVIQSSLVPENEAYIFDARQAAIYERKQRSVEFSFEDKDNFEREMVTVKAYERLNLLVKENQKNAFMHISDIAAGIAAIKST